MTIAIGCDHGGYPLKGEILKYLFRNNYVVVDCGTDSAAASVDYPDYAKKVAEAVKNGEVDRGILLCGTGLGVSIAANKVPGIRCALLSDAYSARMSREHNNCNVMAVGARVTGPGLAEELVDIFLKTEFPGDERHQRRIDKITEIEVTYSK